MSKTKRTEPRHISTEGIPAVVLAASFNRIKLYDGWEPGHKALLDFRGKPSIEYTLAALHSDPRVGPICIIGPQAELTAPLAACDDCEYEYEPGGRNIYDSLARGLEHHAGSRAVLVATEDMPLITPAAVTAFLNAVEATPTTYAQNIFASFVPREAFTGPYADARKTFNRFRNVSVVHGNLAVVEPNLVENVEFAARLESLYEGRKSWITQLRAVGFRLSFAYTLGAFLLPILSLGQMARLVSWRFNIGLIPVLVDHPEICVDIDEPKDYAFVQNVLANRQPEVA